MRTATPAGASAARSQDVKIPPMSKSWREAVETVNVTVDGALLQLAGSSCRPPIPIKGKSRR